MNSELELIGRARFIAFDFDFDFFSIIGSKATCEKIFDLPATVHEAPVWIPDANTILVSPQNQSYQIVIDLNSEPVQCPQAKVIDSSPR